MDDLYGSARSEKIKELRKLMHELMATDGDSPMSADDLTEALSEADDTVEEMDEGEEVATVEDGAGDEKALSEIEQMKRDYFRPKPKPKKDGPSAVMIAKVGSKKPASFSSSHKSGNKYGKRS